MFPLKCAFGVFLEGFTVHGKAIELDPSNTKAIQAIEPPAICIQLKSLICNMFYVSRFIPAVTKLLEPFHKLVKKNFPLQRGEEQNIEFFKESKMCLARY